MSSSQQRRRKFIISTSHVRFKNHENQGCQEGLTIASEAALSVRPRKKSISSSVFTSKESAETGGEAVMWFSTNFTPQCCRGISVHQNRVDFSTPPCISSLQHAAGLNPPHTAGLFYFYYSCFLSSRKKEETPADNRELPGKLPRPY